MKDYKSFERYTWQRSTAKDSDVVVSTRVRLARNLKDYPFSPRLDETGAREIIERVRNAPAMAGFEYTDFSELSPEISMSLAERHIISPEFAGSNNVRGLLSDTDSGLYIMLCEEDHLRLQCLKAGDALTEAYETVMKAEGELDSALSFAYSEKFGYLTHCPTNLGTGMRASVMLFLPALSGKGELPSLRNQLTKLGLTVRGMSGEGSSADGCLYQISNQITLGISEEETVSKLKGIVGSIVQRERELRESISGEQYLRLRDRVRRAVGIMSYAELMETKELFELYSKVRLGAAMGMTGSVSCEMLDGLLFGSLPATITAEAGDASLPPVDRDAVRAAKARALVGSL